uniref:Uncharacterized protein n=1 Tax=Magallana gigas TaxID=29159 RepID=A0A8W8MQG4_MAGGI
QYIDDEFSIDNFYFQTYVDSIYTSELEIKDSAESESFVSYLDILLEMDIYCNLATKLYDKRDDFNFSIVNLSYLCCNIPSSPSYGVFVSQLIRYTRACSSNEQFLRR